MKIVSDCFWVNFQDALEVGNGFFEEAIAFQIFQIANVLAEEGFGATHYADSVFQFTANGKNRLRFALEGNRHGDETARTAQHLRPSSCDTHHGVVAAAQDVAIVNEIRIGNSLEPANCFLVIDGDGLFAEVPAGHHESIEFSAGKKEMVQRRISQEDAEEAV